LLLPVPINPEEVTASFTNGLLKITMARKPGDKVRRVPIEDK
jgi:HSP20 family molecular chaperone IbpA